MTTKDVLALALEALEKLAEHGAYSLSIAEPAITAIKQAHEPKVKLIPTAEEMGTPMQPQAITPETGNAAPPEASAITAGNGQAQEPVQSERERIKAFLHKHKASALPDGACDCCEGEGEIGGQFSGGVQECPDCNGSGKAAPKQAEPALTAHEQRCADVATAMFRNRDGVEEIKAAITEPEGYDKFQIEKAVLTLIYAATFGSTTRYEDGTPTENRLLQLDCAKYLHSLVSADEFESAYEFTLRQFDAMPPCTRIEGWKLVPIEPTQGMLDMARVALEEASRTMARHAADKAAYRAMLAAAPTPPEAKA